MMKRILGALSHHLHRHLLALVVASYALAATCPAAGAWIKEADLAAGSPVRVTIPSVLLAVLLFGAGLRARADRVRQVARRPRVVLAGLAANVMVPLAFLGALLPTLGLWHNPDEAAVVLLGLALVSSMPIAGSSTGWAQAADGDMAVSLGLVLASTLLSPLTTPVALDVLGRLAPSSLGSELRRLSNFDTGGFLALWVLLPSLLGLAVRRALGEARAAALEGRTRAVAPLALLVLCYSNASTCLPQVLRQPDWDFLGLIVALVAGLCSLTFAAGWVIGRVLGVDRGQRSALIFGLGMNNNGTGLVLASLALGSRPLVLLPIIAYNLAQHLVAGGVNALLRRAPLGAVGG